jgi:hypothetical protein
MTGKNNEKYVDEGSYKYNNSFQKPGRGSSLSLLVQFKPTNLNQRTRTTNTTHFFPSPLPTSMSGISTWQTTSNALPNGFVLPNDCPFLANSSTTDCVSRPKDASAPRLV